jgi:D-inositol-3-phosphate glycosyltransferase
VIGSAVGGIKHSVLDGVTGYLVPANDPDALAARLADVYASPARMRELGRNAVRRVNASFTWQRVGASIASLYERIAADRSTFPADRMVAAA